MTAPARVKLYSEMSERERLDFIAEQEQRISNMMGDRPVKLSDDAVQHIKRHVDRYVANMNPSATGSGQRDKMQSMNAHRRTYR